MVAFLQLKMVTNKMPSTATIMIGVLLSVGGIIILVFTIGRQRFRAIMSDGVPIYFDGEPRRILEAITFDYNKQQDKIALLLNDPGRWGEISKTGFIFSPHDFSPNPQHLDWRSYFGVIKCFKNLEGTSDGREEQLKEAHLKLKKAHEENKILSKLNKQKEKEYELEQVSEKKKEETYHSAVMLKDLKKITNSAVDVQGKSKPDYERLIKQ